MGKRVVLTLENYEGVSYCVKYGGGSPVMMMVDAFARINATFYGGEVYGVLAHEDCHAWGFCWALGGRAERSYEPIQTMRILLNGSEVTEKTLERNACFIGENPYLFGFRKYLKATPKKCIAGEIRRRHLPITPEEVRVAFDLSGEHERFNRDMKQVSGEITSISMAIGYAAQKRIFTYPWLTYSEAKRILYRAPHFRLLAESGAIVLVPSNNEAMLRQVCTKIVRWTYDGTPESCGMVVEDA